MYGPAARRKRFSSICRMWVLHQCIKPHIGACHECIGSKTRALRILVKRNKLDIRQKNKLAMLVAAHQNSTCLRLGSYTERASRLCCHSELGSANRDPAVYRDPDQLAITRPDPGADGHADASLARNQGRPQCAIAAPTGSGKTPSRARRPLGHAEADRGSRAVSGRHRRRGTECSRDQRFRTSLRPQSGIGSARFPPRSSDVGGGLGSALSAAGEFGRRTPNDPHFRQHAPAGRACDTPPLRPAGEENVAAHHGSLAKEQRLDAEQRLKHGKLKALVATASLELDIDIGDVDLVCQLGSPRSSQAFCSALAAPAMPSTARQRVGCFRSRAMN